MHTPNLKLEVNIALIPDADTAARFAAASAQVAQRYPGVVQLDDHQERLSTAGHLTLYQAAFAYDRMPEVVACLAGLAEQEAAYTLANTGLAYNEGEGSLEASQAVTDQLVALQDKTIAATNPLRDGLLVDRDPGGTVVAGRLAVQGILGQNIRETGYAEVGDPRQGGLFRPHVTLNWLVPGTVLDPAAEWETLQAVIGQHGRYTALGVYVMGAYGTCPQRLASFALKG